MSPDPRRLGRVSFSCAICRSDEDPPLIVVGASSKTVNRSLFLDVEEGAMYSVGTWHAEGNDGKRYARICRRDDDNADEPQGYGLVGHGYLKLPPPMTATPHEDDLFAGVNAADFSR